MSGMIYVCRYENIADLAIPQERLQTLLLSLGAAERSYNAMLSHVCKAEDMNDKSGERQRQTEQMQQRQAEQMQQRQAEQMRQRLVARAVLDYALQKEFGISLAELGWAEQKGGKPYSMRYPEIKFNISHCESACACAVGVTDVGIDIEKKFAYRNSLARKICHDVEWEILCELDEEKRTQQLWYLWSLKESFVKWNGKGLAYGMDRISFAEVLPIELAAWGHPESGQTLVKYDDFRKYGKQLLGSEILQSGLDHTENDPEFLLYESNTYTLCACAKEFDFTVNLIDTGELFDGKTDKTEI